MKTAHTSLGLSLVLAAAGAAAAGPVVPPAGPVGPTYKTLDQVEARRPVQSLPGDDAALHLITEPGSYYLTGNIQGVAGKAGIRIEASGVTLDLGGFSLVGADAGTHAIASSTGQDVAVVNGAVRGWLYHGVALPTAGNSRVERVRASACGAAGILVGPSSTVWACEVADCGEAGVYAMDRVTIADTTITGSGWRGVQAGEMCSLRNVVSTHNQDSGIYTGADATLSGCIASHNGKGFVLGDSAVLASCTARANADAGVEAGNGCSITGCAVGVNGGAGIRAGSGCTISQNTCRENGGDGIVVSNSNQITGNTCDNNGHGGGIRSGIHVAGTANRVDGNALIANSVGIDVDVAGNFVVRNSVTYSATRYTIVANNTVGQWIINPGGAFVSSDPWANFGF